MTFGGRVVAVLAVFGVALAGGCTSPADDPEPTPAVSATASATDGPTGKWTGLAARCPDFTGKAAQSLGRTGPGKPRDDIKGEPGIIVLYGCGWSGPGPRDLSIDITVDICQTRRDVCATPQERMEVERQKSEITHKDRQQNGSVYEPTASVPGLDDALVSSTIFNNLLLVIGSTDNALIGIYLRLPSNPNDVAAELTQYKDKLDLLAQKKLDENRQNLYGLVADVVDDLR